MGSVAFILPDPEEQKLRAKAKALGIGVSAYLRTLVSDAMRRNPEAHQTELLRALRALVPTLAEAFGRTQNVNRETIEKLSAALLERYEKER